MTRSQQIAALLDRYEKRRLDAQNILEAHIREVRERDPEIARLQDGITERFAECARRMMRDRAQAAAISAALKQATIADQRAIDSRLAGLGLPADYLKMHYACERCQDTGYIGEDRTRFCPCFEDALAKAQWGSDVSASHTFEACDPEIFPNDVQRARTQRAMERCEQYADSFPGGEKSGLLLTGKSGLGKTFLLDAIAQRVQQRGHPALRLTAFQMFEGMRAYHLGEDTGGVTFRQMLSSPLLLIDDLGTEPMMRNITVEYLFLLLSERAGMHTVIATNLTLPEIAGRYGERIVSRLADTRRSEIIQLTGDDLRMRRRP